MSLRTKLLAAVVGLNGVILLLALYLLLGGGDRGSSTPSNDALLDLVALGAALGEGGDAVVGRRARELLDDMEEKAVLRDLVVVQDEPAPRGDPAAPPDFNYRVWQPRELFDRGTSAVELEEGPLRERVKHAFRKARQHGNRWIGDDLIAVVFPVLRDDGHRRGIVAHYMAPRDTRSGVRAVYVVMVVGVVVLTGVFFWLVSRLVVKPLAHLTDAADRIARGDYRIQVERTGTNDEFDRTMAAFNRMAREIGEYQGQLEDRVLKALKRMRKAEQHLAIAQRLAATGKLASGVAHEINNPLGGMKNAVRALGRFDLSTEKTLEYLDLINEGLSRVEETVKKFLSFTPRRIEPRPSDLADVARKALALARHRLERGTTQLQEDLPEPGQAMVFGDPHELQQVALNLLLNAADSVASKGEGGAVLLRVAVLDEGIVLEVEDEGLGIKPEDQDRCFDMFFTTKDVGEGSGLGLAVAHTIVTSHGGRIEVESGPEGGATFRVVLPRELNDWSPTE